MADFQAKFGVNVDTSNAINSIKVLQSQIAALQRQLTKNTSINSGVNKNFQRNLLADVNSSGKYVARMQQIRSTTEQFTNSLERNKFSMGQYFRYAASTSKTFGKKFSTEFRTIEKVARERVKSLQTQYVSMGRDANGALQSIAIRPLKLDLKNLGTQQAINSQKQQIFNQLLRQGSTNLLNFGKNTQWAGRQLMMGFTLPLAIFGSKASSAFMSIEEQAIKFKRVYGELFTLPEEADAMLDSLKELADGFTQYGVSLEDTLSLAGDVAAMGKTGADMLAQVEQATRLSVLGGVDQAKALEASISITNAFGVSAEDLAQKIDFLNAVENQTVLSIEDLTTAIPKAGPVVRQLGGSVEDLAYFMTAMKEGGINASEGANALKSGLARLINPTAKATEFLGGFGINIEKIIDSNAGDITSALIELSDGLDTLDPLNRARAIEELFGRFQFSRLSTLFQNLTAEGSQASRVLDLTATSAKELADLSNKELGNVSNSTTFKFKKTLQDLQIAIAPIGEQFLKAVTPIVEFVTKILQKFESMGDGAKNFLVVLTAVMGAIAPVALMAFGLIANGVANLIKGFAAVRTMFMKTGQDSSVLGSQLQYMSMEQIQAGSVAASLEQSHQRLAQQFTVEREALDMLIASYQRAITTGQGLVGLPGIGGAMGMSSRVAKFASGGVVSGPGNGTSDSILAMISNGEAVIPADVVRKNPGFIDELIAGNVPGFAKGVNLGSQAVRPGSENAIDKLINKLMQLGASAEKVTLTLKKFDTSKPLTAGALKKQAGLDGMQVSGGNKYQLGHLEGPGKVNPVTGERETGSLVRAMPASQNVKLSKNGQVVDEFEQDWKRVTGGLYATVKLGGEELTDGIKKATDQVDDRIGQIAINMAKDGVISDEILAEATRIAIAEAKSKGGDSAKVGKALDRTRDKKVILPATAKTQRQVGILREGETQKQLSARAIKEGRAYQDGRNVRTNDKSLSSTGILSRTSSSGQFRSGHRVPKVPGEKTYLSMGKANAKAYDTGFDSQSSKSQDAYVDKRQRNSPHKLAKKDGQDDARAYQSGFDSTSKKTGSRRASGTMANGQMNVSKTTQSTGPRRASAPAQTASGDAARLLNANLQQANATTAATVKTKQMGSAMTGAMYGLTTLAGMSAMAGGEIGRIGGFLFQLTAGMTALMTVTEALTGQNVIALIQGRLKIAQTRIEVASRLANITGMNSFKASMLKASLATKAFMGPFAVAILSAAAAIAIFAFVSKRTSDAQKKSREQVAAFGAAAKLASGPLAEIASILTGKDIDGPSFGSLGVDSGVAAKRDSLIADDSGKLDPFKDQISSLSNAATKDVQSMVDQLMYNLKSMELTDSDAQAVILALLSKAEVSAQNISWNFKLNKEDLAEQFTSAMEGLDLSEYSRLKEITESAIGSIETKEATIRDLIPMEAKLAQASGVAASAIAGMASQVSAGTVEFDAAEDEIDKYLGIIRLLPAANQKTLINRLADNLGIDPEVIESIDDAAVKMELLRTAALGADVPQELVDAAAGIKFGENSETLRAKTLLIKALRKQIDLANAARAQEPVEEQLAQAQLDLESVQAMIEAKQEENATYDVAFAKLGDQEKALSIATDSTLRQALAAAILADSMSGVAEGTEDATSQVWQFWNAFNELDNLPDLPTMPSSGGDKTTPYQDAVKSLKQQQADIKNTSLAYSRLRQSGLDIATSSRIASDSTLALALATTKVGTSKYKELLSLVKQIDAASQSNAIKDLVSGRSQEIQLKSQFLKIIPIITQMGIEIEDALSILDDQDIAKAFIDDLKDGKLNSKELLNYLKQIQTLKKIDIEVNLMTDDQKWAKVEGAFNDVNSWFDAQSAKIEQTFSSQIKGQQSIIDAAEKSIEEYNDKVAENEYQLDGIQVKEDAINKKYDSRIESLDKIVQINKLVQAQQKGSLSVADALSRGDIAEAARAAQAARVELASANAEDLKSRIATAKEKEIASVTAANGQTRVQIEAEIEEYKIRISAIEHDTVRPAEKIRDAAIATMEAEKSALTYLGLNQEAWKGIEINATAAKVEAEGYKKAIEDAMLLYAEMVGMELPEAYSGKKPESTASKMDSLNAMIQENRDAVRSSAGTTAADKKMMAENVKLIKELRTLTGDTTTTGGFSKAMGGVVKRFASGGMAMGTDTVPAMLTPGEFVIKRPSVKSFGVDRLKAINNGTYSGDSVYTYNLSVNVQSESNPSEIASTVMAKIKQVESKRLRGGRF
jgi:TP901 family phage tail tape measure protein